MYQQIKKLADDALALQNKDQMDAALREISAMCAEQLKTTHWIGDRTPNPVVLDGPLEEIVARSPEADALISKAVAAKPAKKGGAK